jgi:hypothetical protein
MLSRNRIPKVIKRILPGTVKHPLLASSQWYWNLRGLPAQSTGDMAIFKEVLSNAGDQMVRVFEWGSGASSIFYPKYLKSTGRKFDWHAMENSAPWHKKTQERIIQSRLADEVSLHFSEFPAFWQLPGFSADNPVPSETDTDSANVLDYIDGPKNIGGPFDVLIIDGRFRRRCLLAARDVLAPGGVVILHDAQKIHYHPSLSSFPNVRFVRSGPLPGSSQPSTIALCTLEDYPWLGQLLEKYNSFNWVGNS